MRVFNILREKKNLKIFLFLTLIITLLYFLFVNLRSALRIVQVPVFSLGDKIILFFRSLFDVGQLYSFPMLLLVVLFVLSLAIFFLLLFILYQASEKLGQRRSAFGTLGILISVLGLTCASCGIGLLASLLSFFGVEYLVSYFPWHGLELGFLGVVCLNISNYLLWKRLKNPYTCD